MFWCLFRTNLLTTTNFEKFIPTFSQLIFLWTCFFLTSQDFEVWTLFQQTFTKDLSEKLQIQLHEYILL